jgi:pimeloyl-ACP methyl ester carboxylesterase
MKRMLRVATQTLEIACEESGPSQGPAVVLLHGFPYDPRAFDAVADQLGQAGCRVLVPYLRGYGPTRFLQADTMRSGQQGALAHDLLDLMDRLGLAQAVLGGFDWGGRAACVAAAMWPHRVRGLVTCCGYQIQDIAASARPADPQTEHRMWYQYYFHTERGRAGLTEHRDALCRELWRLWSPAWAFDEATFARSAVSFQNPDFVEVVLHSYRHRFGYAPGDPRYAQTETLLSSRPPILVPSIGLHGISDGVNPPAGSVGHERLFGPQYERRLLDDAGHNPPQESPQAFARAILDLMR